MAATTRGRIPVRAAKLSVELLESRDVASATPGFVVEYQEGYEYGDGTAIGWATGGYTAEPGAGATDPAPEMPAVTAEPVAVEDVRAMVYLDGELVAEVEGEPSLAFFAPPVGGAVIPGGETIVYVNGQPVGAVRGTPAVAVVGAEARRGAGGPEAGPAPSYVISSTTDTGPELPDGENFDLTLTAWVD